MRQITSYLRMQQPTANLLQTHISKKWSFTLGICLYFSLSAIVFSGINADDQWQCHHRLTHVCDEEMVMQDKGLAALLAMLPLPGWPIAFLHTEGFHHGFSFEATPHIHLCPPAAEGCW